MAKKKVRKPAVVPPKGAPTNLRPAGAHGELRKRPRSQQLRAAIEEEEPDPREDAGASSGE